MAPVYFWCVSLLSEHPLPSGTVGDQSSVCVLCPSPGVSRFSKAPWFPLAENGTESHHGGDAYAHCYKAPVSETYACVCVNTHTHTHTQMHVCTLFLSVY